MMIRTRIGAALAMAGAAACLWHAPARAASEVDAGAYLEQAMDAAHRDMVRDSLRSESRVSLGGVRISVEAGDASAVTGFTPRFAGIGTTDLDRPMPEVAAAARARQTEGAEPARHGLRIGPDGGTEIAGLEVNWAAVAAMEEGADTAVGSESAFMVGGEMAVANWRVDATYGQDPGLLGLEGDRYTAGLGYDFGPLNTRVAYSMIENEEEATETSMFTVGSQLSLQPWFVVEGDLAYADDERGAANTAGRVSLRLNF